MSAANEVIPTSRRAIAYTALIIIIGTVLAIHSFYMYFTHIDPKGISLEIQQMLCLIVLCVLCRSLPITVGNGMQTLDISVVSIMAAVLTKGMYAAVVVYLVSSLFTVDYEKDAKKYHHLYNTSPIKSAFNNANLTITIIINGLLFQLAGGVPGRLELPGVLWPSLVFSLFSFFIDSMFLLILFILDKRVKPDDAVQMMRDLLPNVLFAMPLGLLMAMLFVMENGHWLAMLMLFPLLLARYAWALYVESQVQHMRLIHAFVSAMEAKDTYTEGHSRRVETFAVQIANKMKLPKEKVKEIQIAALLHDIGKIGIEDIILRKPARLTDEERHRIEEHPTIGVSIVEKVGLSEEIKEMIRHHHERYDGKGYPDHLDHNSVSFEAYILGVADAFDAMTSDRPYRAGMSDEKALSILKEESGKQFHPDIVAIFEAVLKEETEQKEQTAPIEQKKEQAILSEQKEQNVQA